MVSKISKQESAAYFEKRPYLSQIGAAASNQSNPIESREALENKFEKFRGTFPEGSKVPMPQDCHFCATEYLKKKVINQ